MKEEKGPSVPAEKETPGPRPRTRVRHTDAGPDPAVDILILNIAQIFKCTQSYDLLLWISLKRMGLVSLYMGFGFRD